VNSLDASSIDEAVGLPSPEARLFNLDAQHIITHEANVPLVADPLGGSYYLEWLTSRMESEVSAYLEEIDAHGGVYACLESGWLNGVMEECRAKVQHEKAEGERLIVGVNAFRSEGEDEGPINDAIRDVAYKAPSVAMREERVREVTQFKAGRDMRRLKPLTRDLFRTAREGGNVQRAVIEAAKAGLTIGECVGVIRLGYGIGYDPFKQIEMPDFVRETVEG
jgi:methylmalonyl-CoA mutase N-terminal domain/subunit